MTDLEVSNTFVEENMGLVYATAKKFIGRGVDFEDIVQIGSVGLVKASKNFDPEVGVKFSTYAVSVIIGEIKRFFRDDGMVKIPRKTKEMTFKVKVAMEYLKKKNGIEPKIQDIAAYTGFSAEAIVEAIEAGRSYVSIYEETGEDTYVLDLLESEPEREITIEERIFIKEMLGKLDARARQIILLRFFKEKTQQEVADLIGVSQVQVSRLEKKALQILRKYATDN